MNNLENYNVEIDCIYDENYWNNVIYPNLINDYNNWFDECIKNLNSLNGGNNLNFTENQITDSNLKLEILSRFNPKYFLKIFARNKLLYIGDFPINYNFLNKANLIGKINFRNSRINNIFNSSWSFFNRNILINKSTHINNEEWRYGDPTNILENELSFANEHYKSKYYDACYKSKAGKLSLNIRIYNSLFAITNVLDGLEFSYKTGTALNKNSFENWQFNELYNWDFNDELKIRMIFTPWFMENYLIINNFKSPALDKYQINLKKGLFYSNNYIKNVQLSSINNSYTFIDFFENNISIKQFKDNLFNDIVEIIKNKYDSLSFLTILPIIYTEDQTQLYMDLFSAHSSDDSIEIQDEDYCEPFFIINDSLNFCIKSNYIKNDIDIKKFSKTKINNIIFNEVIFSIYYVGENPITRKYKKCGAKIYQEEREFNLVYTKLNYSDYYYYYSPGNVYSNTNFNNKDEVDNIVKKMCKDYKISNFVIDDGYLSIIINKNNNDIVDQIKTIIDKYNNNLTY